MLRNDLQLMDVLVENWKEFAMQWSQSIVGHMVRFFIFLLQFQLQGRRRK